MNTFKSVCGGNCEFRLEVINHPTYYTNVFTNHQTIETTVLYAYTGNLHKCGVLRVRSRQTSRQETSIWIHSL